MLTSDWLLQLVSVMKQRYQGLISEAGSQDSMSTGQMLLCAVNSLLDKVDVDMVQLRDSITSLGSVKYDRINISSITCSTRGNI